MDPNLKTNYLILKERAFKNQGFKEGCENMFKQLKKQPDLIEGLAEIGIPLYQIILIMDLLIEEHENTTTDLFKQLTIFNCSKTIN